MNILDVGIYRVLVNELCRSQVWEQLEALECAYADAQLAIRAAPLSHLVLFLPFALLSTLIRPFTFTLAHLN